MKPSTLTRSRRRVLVTATRKALSGCCLAVLSLVALSSFSGNLNEDAFGTESPQNAQNCIEIRCEQVSLDPAQVTAFDMGGSCKLDFCPSLAEAHRADGRTDRQR